MLYLSLLKKKRHKMQCFNVHIQHNPFRRHIESAIYTCNIFASQGCSLHSAPHKPLCTWEAEWSENPWLAKMLYKGDNFLTYSLKNGGNIICENNIIR